MNLMKVFEFDPVIYPYKLWVCLDKEPNKIEDLFDEYSGKKIVFIGGDTDIAKAFTMPVMDSKNRHYGVVVFIRSKASLTYELVAHEATHAAKYLFEHIGCDYSKMRYGSNLSVNSLYACVISLKCAMFLILPF